MEPFIRAMEVWAPTHDGAELELGSGSYAELYALRDASTRKRFAFGAGLPGKVWESRRPLAMRTDEPHFQRSAVARSSAISHAIGLPIFSSQYLIGVVVLLCGSSAASVGAIELWHCDTANSYDMKLVDGHFGTLEHFETVARCTSFRPGTGLPGEVWQQRLPVVMHGLGRTHRFVRFDDAREAGLTMGFGIPLFHDPEQAHVLTLLSALGTPIARRIEVWVPSEDGLRFHDGFCAAGTNLAVVHGSHRISSGSGVLGRVWLTGVPAVANDEPIAGIQKVHSSLVAWPVIEAGKAKALVAMYA